MKAPNEPIEILHVIVRMLTREGRVSFDIADESEKLLVSINTINREYGRLLGGGGQAIRDINTIAKSIIGDIEVRLLPRADDSIGRSDESPCQPVELLKAFVEACQPLDGSEITPIQDGAVINTQCQDDVLVAAIDRTFYNIGRAQRGLLRIEWNR